MSTYKETFKKYLEQNGGRYTAQKEEILSEVFKTKTHFEVDEFLLQLLKKKKKISRATFYRTIKQLLSANLLQRVATDSGKVYYETSVDQQRHDHMICNVCGRILEIKGDKVDKFLKKICKELNFEPEYRSLHIYGKCTAPQNCAGQ